MRVRSLAEGACVCAAAISGLAAVPEVAGASATRAPSVSVVSVTPLNANDSSSVVPLASGGAGTYPCVTFPDEPCYAVFNQNKGTSVNFATFLLSPQRSDNQYCKYAEGCTVELEAIAYGLNSVVSWTIHGPGIRDVEVF